MDSRTVAEALRLPYVAIEVDGRVLASAGRPWPGVQRVAKLQVADRAAAVARARDAGLGSSSGGARV